MEWEGCVDQNVFDLDLVALFCLYAYVAHFGASEFVLRVRAKYGYVASSDVRAYFSVPRGHYSGGSIDAPLVYFVSAS